MAAETGSAKIGAAGTVVAGAAFAAVVDGATVGIVSMETVAVADEVCMAIVGAAVAVDLTVVADAVGMTTVAADAPVRRHIGSRRADRYMDGSARSGLAGGHCPARCRLHFYARCRARYRLRDFDMDSTRITTLLFY